MDSRALVLAALALATGACASTPPKNAWTSQEQVPSNSAFDGANAANDASAQEPTAEAAPSEKGSHGDDATDESAPTPLVPEEDDSDKANPGGSKSPKGGAAPATRKQCEAMIDKYVDLLMQSMPALKGMGKELIEQAKATARAQKGDPCEGGVTKAQHDCAMKAKTKDAWETCTK